MPPAPFPTTLPTWRVFVPLVIALYALLLLPVLVHHHFDTSLFIVAGDRFANPAHLVSPIIVRPHSDGYDGQFYYRLALNPFDVHQGAYGIRFDRPAWRMQRIVYSLLAWCLAFGRPALVPASLVLVNLLGLGAIAALTLRLTARLALPKLTPLAILLWPGFLVTLTNDTTEIVSAAFLLAAVDAYLADHVVLYCFAGALATLTRETGVLFLAGVFCFEAWRAFKHRLNWRASWRLALCAIAIVPFLAWQQAQAWIWGVSPQGSGAAAHALGWPFFGALELLADTWRGTHRYAISSLKNACVHAYILFSAVWLLTVLAWVASRVPGRLRDTSAGALAAGWLPILALMSLLPFANNGPWVEPKAYFRAFTECFVIGCLVLARRPPSVAAMRALMAAETLCWAGAWVLYVT